MFLPMGEGDGTARRLRPEMASSRLLVLDFVRSYIGRWGHSPSYNEIAAGLKISRDAVKRAVRSLVRDGLLLKSDRQRGLALPDEQAQAIRVLRVLGWTVNEDVATAAPLSPLLRGAVLDYDPLAGGEIRHGSRQRSSKARRR